MDRQARPGRFGRIIGPLCLMILICLTRHAHAELRAEAIVLVNSQAMDCTEFHQFLEPYLVQFGIPYTVHDISKKPLGSDLQEYALVIIGHRGFDVPHHYLTPDGEHQLLAAIQQGTGLVSFDGILSAWKNNQSRKLYQFIENIFDFSYEPSATADTITIGPSATVADKSLGIDYITATAPTPRTLKLKRSMIVPGFQVGSKGTVLAMAGNRPLLIGNAYGQGNVVLFSTYEWSRPDVKGRIYGLDDLIWRSLVWAARKPFVMRGMPHFLAFRVDDVSGFGLGSNQHLGWVNTVNRFGLRPWLGLFIDDLKNDPESLKKLALLTQQGLATASIHARRWRDFFYLEEPLWTDAQERNIAGRAWPDEKMAGNFAEGEAFLAEHDIVRSKLVIPHFCEFAVNNFAGLKREGVEFVGVLLQPGHGWGMATVPAGPYLPSEPPRPTNAIDPVYIADWLTVPGHPEFEHDFFNFVLEVHDVAGYEWAPSGVPVEEAIRRGVEETRREWDSLLPGVLFTHESDHIQHIMPEDWDRILKGVMNGLRSYQPVPVTLDSLCQYLRALKTSRIQSARFNQDSKQLEVEFEGTTDLPTRFYVFSSDQVKIRSQDFEVGPFQKTTKVKHAVGPID
jgi:hypothetical protein